MHTYNINTFKSQKVKVLTNSYVYEERCSLSSIVTKYCARRCVSRMLAVWVSRSWHLICIWEWIYPVLYRASGSIRKATRSWQLRTWKIATVMSRYLLSHRARPLIRMSNCRPLIICHCSPTTRHWTFDLTNFSFFCSKSRLSKANIRGLWIQYLFHAMHITSNNTIFQKNG